MGNPRRTFYEDLGLGPRASGLEIDRAYRSFRKKMDDVSAVPDPPREARMKLAFETLSDPAKREAYDAHLAGGGARSEGGSRAGLFAVIGIVVVGAIAGAVFFMRPSATSPADPANRLADELTRMAARAVHRVDSTDAAGKAAPLGVAFAIGEGTVATSCGGIAPASNLTLFVPAQPVPVKLAATDEKLGVCKLAASGIGASPLAIAAADPNAGDTVFLTQVDGAGAVYLQKAKVTKVAPSSRGGTVVETSIAIPTEQRGGPVLNERGQVIGMALPGEVVRLTPEWAAQAVEIPAPAAAPEVAAAPATQAAAPPKGAAPAKAAAPLPPLPALPAPTAAPATPEKAAPKSTGSMTPEELAEDRRRRLDEALQKNIR